MRASRKPSGCCACGRSAEPGGRPEPGPRGSRAPPGPRTARGPAIARPRCRTGKGPRSGDLQALGAGSGLLRQGQLEHAVLVGSARALLVDLGGQRETARHRAAIALATQHPLAFAGLAFLAYLGRDGNAVAVDLDMDVILVDAWKLGRHLVVGIGL